MSEDKPERGDIASQFKPGNQLWRLASNQGRPRSFASPAEMWERAVAYFEWVDSRPLIEEKVFNNQGDITRAQIGKMRAMTLRGMFVHMGIGSATWSKYKHDAEYSNIAEQIESVIFEQKLSGAAADLLNSNIISRELGLADKQETKIEGKMGLHDLSEAELDRMIEDNEREIAAGTKD